LKLHEEQKAAATVLTVKQENPFGYGRIIRDREGNVLRIVEEKDANESEKAVKEVNSGTYCFDSNLLFEAINEVKSENVQGEYYLTDVLEILKNKGQKVSAFMTENPMEVMGVNTIEALKVLEDILLKNK
jgi:bifunctional UDP-N-acetylglucosamine pyrophosphorylase/glucosamine-1-phosphate N-acetyltransferase